MRIICSVSISNKSFKYFLKIFTFLQIFRKISRKCQLFRNSPNTYTKYLQNFLKIFSTNFTQNFWLFYLKMLLIIFYQTVHTKFSKISSLVSVILLNFLQNLAEFHQFSHKFQRIVPNSSAWRIHQNNFNNMEHVNKQFFHIIFLNILVGTINLWVYRYLWKDRNLSYLAVMTECAERQYFQSCKMIYYGVTKKCFRSKNA